MLILLLLQPNVKLWQLELVARCRPFPFFGVGERVWHRAIEHSVLGFTRKQGKTTLLKNTCPATFIHANCFCASQAVVEK